MPGNGGGNGGGDNSSFSTNGYWQNEGEGERTWVGGGAPPAAGFAQQPAGPQEPAPHVPVIREARNVQKANIDRSSLYDPTQTTQALGRDYLQQRNATNPQPLGSTGAGAVGYEFAPSNERLY